ncbi:hypothetical protein LJC36_03675 [Desulfovibrio sp. OttesenSCG-928-C14]|nr:hypothetical protein [Desulfovibrio sp. OttesenSCG-928-C14]
MPLSIINVDIDAACQGERWHVSQDEHLARAIAVVSMGQSAHAATIIRSLLPVEPAFLNANLFNDARAGLKISGSTEKQQKISRWHRDGFIFEVISWIAIQKTASLESLMKSPHIKSTTQGLDGLLLELSNSPPEITRTTICEDKCSQNPQNTFQYKVLPAFKKHHAGERARELLAEASSLLEKICKDGTEATKAAARVLDLNTRRYRAALTIEEVYDSAEERKKIFQNFDMLTDIHPQQRLGATFVVQGKLREYFDQLAAAAIEFLNQWEKEASNVR